MTCTLNSNKINKIFILQEQHQQWTKIKETHVILIQYSVSNGRVTQKIRPNCKKNRFNSAIHAFVAVGIRFLEL